MYLAMLPDPATKPSTKEHEALRYEEAQVNSIQMFLSCALHAPMPCRAVLLPLRSHTAYSVEHLCHIEGHLLLFAG